MHSSVYFIFIKQIIMSLKSNGHFVYDMESKFMRNSNSTDRKVNEPDKTILVYNFLIPNCFNI